MIAIYCAANIIFGLVSDKSEMNQQMQDGFYTGIYIQGVFLFIAVCVLIFSSVRQNHDKFDEDDD